MIIPITNESKNFYAHLGQVFGSREVQKITGDRFYDDPGKVWYLFYNRGVPDAFVSIYENTMKNVWADDRAHLTDVLKHIHPMVGVSIVPKVFRSEFEKAGYAILENGSKNFIKVAGAYHEED